MFSFVETKLFTRLVQEYLTDDEYAQLQQALIANPEVGSVIPGSGGVRKMRWGVAVAAKGVISVLSTFCVLSTVRSGRVDVVREEREGEYFGSRSQTDHG